MKKHCIILLFFVLITSFSFGQATITAKLTGGNWTDTNTWIENRLPNSSDVILIPVNSTVTVIGNVNLRSTGISTVINIYGTLTIYGRIRLDINDNDIVNVFDGGEINGAGFVQFGNGWSSETVWVTPDAPIDIPISINDGISTPLPIELISFNTTLSGEVVEILWETAAEINNDYFTLERSEDGVNWEIIGEEAGAGNSTVRLDYSFIDHNLIPGISYYRLKQTDYDGQFEYFDPEVVLYEPDNLFKVFPNPTTDVLQLTTSSDLSNATISIKNLSGQTKAVRVDAFSHQASIDVSELPTGVYLLKIVFPQSILTKRIIKN